jgi:hypothetical protein
MGTMLVFDLVGFMITMSTIAVVASSSSILIGRIRQGFLALMWGFGFIALSFVWAIVAVDLRLMALPNWQPIILVFGTSLMLFSSHRLFGYVREAKKIHSANP